MTGQDAAIIACQLVIEVSELEKAQAHQVSELEKARDLRESDRNFRVRAISALRRRDLSAISKRFVMEGILRAVVSAIPKSSALKAALNGTQIPAPYKKLMQEGGTNVRMTTVNEAMLNEPFRLAAWQALDLPSDVPFPSLPGEMLYGDLKRAPRFTLRR